MTDWRSLWDAVVASDVSARDGLGWEFTSRTGKPAWAVFREDSGPFPVFSAARGHIMPSADDLAAMTHEAVADLLAAAGLADRHGWITENISAALLLASMSVESWEGVEWALESGPNDVAIAWAEPDAARTPYAWLRAVGADASAEVSVYQDDALFGLCFIPTVELRLPESDSGSLRSRRGIPLVCGPINQVEVVYDNVVEGRHDAGLVSEVLLHGDHASTLLIAAEAYSRHEWHLFDESVVALTDPTTADALAWIPERHRWRRTEGDP
ncbi:hypothetical protein [Micromonospora sp. NPDC005707]|uniref:hypothetical protein n=1 Tax=Micromonospora sp. NPDC005707 TaxID=3157050 RepID=UPI0033C4EEAD